jgi:RNA polymerase sigma-70 factor (ECF subfamily)
MLALERLSPLERAAFLLHDVFAVPLEDVAQTLDRDAAAMRQLASRARKHVQANRPRFPIAREEGDRIAQAFFTASRSGDVDALRSLLTQNVVIRTDGGGKVHAFRNPIRGVERVLRLYAGLRRKLGDAQSPVFAAMRIDGLPGYISYERDGVLQTTAFAIEDGRIAAVYITRNPDKLRKVMRLLGPESSALH